MDNYIKERKLASYIFKYKLGDLTREIIFNCFKKESYYISNNDVTITIESDVIPENFLTMIINEQIIGIKRIGKVVDKDSGVEIETNLTINPLRTSLFHANNDDLTDNYSNFEIRVEGTLSPII